MNKNKRIVVEFTNERIIPASGLAVVGAILGKCDFVKHLNRMDVTKNRSRHQIKNVDMLRANGIVPSGMPNGYVPVDIDVTPFDNSKSNKQGESCD